MAEPAPVHELADGSHVLVRPLVASDRDRLAEGFELLSAQSRRLRFFNPPEHLSPRLLDYLTELDYDRHFALAAIAVDAPGEPGVGVARWIRQDDDPTKAEAAVTVLDQYQGRGIGTLLLIELAGRAVALGVRTFVGRVLWENEALLDGLRAFGARIEPDEPGVARVEVDLAPKAEQRESVLARVIGAARRLGTDRGDG
jgi:GNAT superfamily N-acetyltransferase